MNRRHFLRQCGQVAVGSAAGLVAAAKATQGAPGPTEPLPTIPLGDYRITRLVVGSNPINGNSYLGPHTDRHMREYFTVERAAELLRSCEQAGINTHQFSTSALAKAEAILRKAREQGSQMHFICLASDRKQIQEAVDKTRPIAVVHHGGATDRCFSEGKAGQVRDFVKAVHDQGLLAGVSAHNPDCIQKIADEGWPVDCFMACFYFVTRKAFAKAGQPAPEPETLQFSYPFYRDDPAAMTRVMRQVKQPCLGFKILAGGRKCGSQQAVREAFRFAFGHIKPGDGVIVGIYPWHFDEVSADAQYTRDCHAPTT